MLRSTLLSASAIALALALAPAASAQSPAAPTAEAAASDINVLFDEYDAAQLSMSPLGKAYRGIKDNDYSDWNDVSPEAELAEHMLLQGTAARMREEYDPSLLSEQDALSYRLFNAVAEREQLNWPFRDYGYIFDHRTGPHTSLPAFLINIHRIGSVGDAEAYISRIEGLGPLMDQLIVQSAARAERGIMPPDWVYPYIISDIEALLAAGDGNAVLDDFNNKVGKLEINPDDANGLNYAAQMAWNQSARPAYERLLVEMKRQAEFAPEEDGVWRLPDGDAYYAARLKSYTTTDLTADELHTIGLNEVARIHDEMRAIMAKVGFEGTLQDFFEFTRSDDRFYYTTREEYLADAQAKLDAMELKLPQYFGRLPDAKMIIKPVEAFREKSAGKAFYQSPSADGSRPGTYYANLFNLRDMSKNELEALAYHEGLPGHHLQRALQTELGELPPFRRFGGFTAYTEGWGLYTEELGKDMGFYQDPYSDFGRLGMELWRACRLVVDTGIHSKQWSREEAIQYLKDNTPNPEGDIVKAIERYITTPGQATAYTIGKLKIMELRSRAQAQLGERFDFRAFHDTVLTSGPVPLSILEENVDAWIAQTRTGK